VTEDDFNEARHGYTGDEDALNEASHGYTGEARGENARLAAPSPTWGEWLLIALGFLAQFGFLYAIGRM
jgi:hypothetical protein